ncbi:MAG TPA: glycosyltransferase family 2 protein [Candidatus Eremiobacteraceae bacterium]|nr:glycosyltransferase family 2 protein [Candidatus Eremiobacteraceae bacterium]
MASLSVIVPTYRRPSLLRRAVASALGQTYRDLVVIVFDNASGDETESVVAAFASRDARVRYVCRDRNVGGPANFARALDEITTPYFAFLSDDDALFPRCYETCFRGFAAAPDALMSAASTLEMDASGSVRFAPLGLWPRDGVYRPPESILRMLDNRHPTWTSVVFKRDALSLVGGLDLEVGPPSDLDFELRIAARFPVVIDRTPSAVFSAHAASNTARQDAAVADGMLLIANKLAADVRIPAPIRAAVGPRLARQIRWKLFEVCVKALVRGDDSVAREALARLRGRGDGGVLRLICGLLVAACRNVPGVRALLRSAERARLAARARRAAATLAGRDLQSDLRWLDSIAGGPEAKTQA